MTKTMEQVIEDLHTSMKGVRGIDPPVPGDMPRLNTVDSVDGIVRNFVSDVLTKFSMIGTNGYTNADFLNFVNNRCFMLNGLFIGYDECPDVTYTRGIWNTPQYLGAFMRLMNAPGDCRTGVRDALMSLANDVVKTFVANADGPVEQWGWKLDALAQSMTAHLLGARTIDDLREDLTV